MRKDVLHITASSFRKAMTIQPDCTKILFGIGTGTITGCTIFHNHSKINTMAQETAKEITVEEGNKLIAEFTGLKQYPEFSNQFARPEEILIIDGNTYADNWFRQSQLQYHSSWDWLMPAWQKFHDEIYLSEEFQDASDKYVSHEITCFRASLEMALIEGAYKHFVNIIQWYNTQL